ncbi:MAG: 4-hydroxy-tetrahydrodipicolinate synthase [Propionibacteriaceae bacterium]|nr:4-hydroxy-tetrahydrodipicolinate synthase [Propionibacteriaceae bacterium]
MQENPIFGRLITAMVTPFAANGALDVAQIRKLAAYLVDEQANDALVINGTTGECPTTSDGEKQQILTEVVAAVGDRAKVIAGVGTFNTAHTLELVKAAEDAGVDGLLVVTPYYSRPPQAALADHFLTVAEATSLPIMIYDIPHRSGIPVETSTFKAIAACPNIVAVKDAKGLPVVSAQVIADTDLAFYAGDDAMLLPLMGVGGVGVVGTSTHFTGKLTKEVIELFLAGQLDAALQLYQQLLPVYSGVFATQGCLLVKAGLAARGFDVGGVRKPLLPATKQEATDFIALLDAASL